MPTDSLTFKAVQVVARTVARLILLSKHCLASQHIKGELNIVSDLLSFEGESRGKPHPLAFDSPDDELLTARFHTYLPSQMPPDFSISRLPKEILSWITLVLRIAKSFVTPAGKQQTSTKTGLATLDHFLRVQRHGARPLPHCSTQPRERAPHQVLPQLILNCFVECHEWT
jgi:hypothetical protein